MLVGIYFHVIYLTLWDSKLPFAYDSLTCVRNISSIVSIISEANALELLENIEEIFLPFLQDFFPQREFNTGSCYDKSPFCSVCVLTNSYQETCILIYDSDLQLHYSILPGPKGLNNSGRLQRHVFHVHTFAQQQKNVKFFSLRVSLFKGSASFFSIQKAISIHHLGINNYVTINERESSHYFITDTLVSVTEKWILQEFLRISLKYYFSLLYIYWHI